ncbi:phosphotransferase enzyme family protein [Ornithinimicrobium sp. LYQ92]|uniref:phosphotransferase enzyme family protein n=1 Tax=Serinicoccus sp. LYQ92 TaxID=3378798 RepID=UPI003852BBDD
MPLSSRQQAVVDGWLPGAEVVADHAWGLVDTTVLQVRHQGQELTVKAGGPDNHHIGREIDAHEHFTAPLRPDRAPRLLHADRASSVLVTTWLPGHLVEGHAAEVQPETYRQAGELLGRWHGQASRPDEGWLAEQRDRAARWLDQPHRIPPEQVDLIQERLARARVERVTLVPTHGDLSPRNWLVHRGRISLIDFGRAAWRPAATDLARLEAGAWRDRPDLEAAFFAGYGQDPRATYWWPDTQLAEAVGTAAWAHQVGDEPFERHGLQMLSDALAG